MRHDAPFFVLCLLVIAALLIKDAPRPVATEAKTPAAQEGKVPVANEDRASAAKHGTEGDAGQAAGSVARPSLTPNCEKELRRTSDLLRFFANRIQAGEETQSVVADMRQQEKKISAVCEQ